MTTLAALLAACGLAACHPSIRPRAGRRAALRRTRARLRAVQAGTLDTPAPRRARGLALRLALVAAGEL